jgi:hypothetical protein
MRKASHYIIISGIAVGCLSVLYFLSLVLHIPFVMIIPVIAAAIIFFFSWAKASETTDNVNGLFGGIRNSIASTILIIALIAIIQKTFSLAGRYGGWDAWCIWNLHAKYMAGGVGQWQKLFLTPVADHTDYPLLVPGVVGFFMRLSGSYLTVPFVFCFCILLLIPVLLFVELGKKSLVVGSVVLLLFAYDMAYLKNAVSQYADTPLAFFFLCAVICMYHAKEERRNISLAAMCLGCCIWTKNEGIALACVFVAFNFKALFAGNKKWYFLSGIALPLLVLLVFKWYYAPANDLVSGQSTQTFHQLLDAGRYRLIYKFFSEQISNNYYYSAVFFMLYLVVCLITKEWPGRQFAMLTGCMALYAMIYVLSPQHLEWHLSTSIERLMHQLMPAFMYVTGLRFAQIRLFTLKTGFV